MQWILEIESFDSLLEFISESRSQNIVPTQRRAFVCDTTKIIQSTLKTRRLM